MSDPFASIRQRVVGEGRAVRTPYGLRRLTYLDWAASGRAFGPIEEWILGSVLPTYGNTHTETSAVGGQTTAFREEARALIKAACGCGEDDALIFCGSGATGAIHTLFACMGLTRSCVADEGKGDAVVLIGSMEHHSVEVAARESRAHVEVVRDCGEGGVELDHLRELCAKHRRASVLIGCFSAASNVTGRLTDVDAVAAVMHECGGVAFFDYAAAGPYVDVRMSSAGGWKDAVFISPHKFLGGPGAPGIVIAKRHLFRNRVPAVPGGGTVLNVTPRGHAYLRDPEHREEGGTPNIVGAIRAGLAFQLRASVGAEAILAHEQDFAAHFIEALRAEPGVEVLGDLDEPRLGIVSFIVHCTVVDDNGRTSTKALHHNFVVALLNDLFGVQARGGNSCAAPYAHRLLGVHPSDEARIDQLAHEGLHGCKPGWTRISFGWCDSEDTLAYAVACVKIIARHGWRFLPDYDFNPATGTWRHRGGAAPLLRLGESAPAVALPESVRGEYLREAEALAAAPRAPVALEPTPYEDVRWFWLPGEIAS
jgi:selenocysteine lyase/cysteine desulfurase